MMDRLTASYRYDWSRSAARRHVGLYFWLLSLVICGLSVAVSATSHSTPPGQNMLALPPITVTAPRVETPIDQVPAAISVITQDSIQQGQTTLGLDESLVRIPGLFPQNRFNFAQDVRLSIRGFGARAAFGIRGLKILVDGIPNTLPDGQSQVDSLDLGSAQRIEVMRGPASALYGNASGGVISITTEDGPAQPFVETRTLHGEFGLWKQQLKSGGQAGSLNYLFNLSRLELGGYRDQSRTESRLFHSKLRFDLNDHSELTAVVSLVDSPQADDPGGLTRDQANKNPRQAASINQRFQTGEEVAQQRIGLIYRHELNALTHLELTGYVTSRQFQQALPFRVIAFDRLVLGGGVQYSYRGNLFGHQNRLTAGVEVQHQDDRRRNFSNDDQTTPGAPGATVLLLQDEQVTSLGAYLQNEFWLWDTMSLTLGGRYDRIRFELDDALLSDGDNSGSRTFEQFTGRLGLVAALDASLNLYVNLAQSFETPTTTEIVNQPNGNAGINPDIEPQKALNVEIGAKGTLFNRVSYEAALFLIALRDELIPFENDDTSRTFFRNAGKSQRYGVELGLSSDLLPGLRASLAYTYLHAVFREFVLDNGTNLDGNDVPGLPTHQLHSELTYRHPFGFYGGLDVLYVGAFYIDDHNTETTNAYTVVNLRLGADYSVKKWTLAPFFGIQNLFDETYNSNVRINAFGNRFFEPAPSRNLYGGLSVSYQW